MTYLQAWPAALVLLLSLTACSKETPETVTPADQDRVSVTGEVTAKDDQVPVDGGVTITLKLDNDLAEILVFGSLFTDPPPSQKQLELYQVIVQVEVGDQVQATGRRGEQGILLEDLSILGKR